jgi:hypothetical protein
VTRSTTMEFERIATLPTGERLCLRKLDAAKALSISDEVFDKYVAPFVPCVRLGSVRLYPVAEIQKFLANQAALPLEER